MEELVGKIVHGRWGYNCTKNDFCVIVRDSPKTVVLAPLETKWVEGTVKYFNGLPVLGMEVPILPSAGANAFATWPKPFRARKCSDRAGVWFSAKGRIYRFWDGKPKHWDSN